MCASGAEWAIGRFRYYDGVGLLDGPDDATREETQAVVFELVGRLRAEGDQGALPRALGDTVRFAEERFGTDFANALTAKIYESNETQKGEGP